SVDPAIRSATATDASLADAIMIEASSSPSVNCSPSARYTCEPPILLAHFDAVTTSSRRIAPSRTCSIAISTVIILVIDAGGQRSGRPARVLVLREQHLAAVAVDEQRGGVGRLRLEGGFGAARRRRVGAFAFLVRRRRRRRLCASALPGVPARFGRHRRRTQH